MKLLLTTMVTLLTASSGLAGDNSWKHDSLTEALRNLNNLYSAISAVGEPTKSLSTKTCFSLGIVTESLAASKKAVAGVRDAFTYDSKGNRTSELTTEVDAHLRYFYNVRPVVETESANSFVKLVGALCASDDPKISSEATGKQLRELAARTQKAIDAIVQLHD